MADPEIGLSFKEIIVTIIGVVLTFFAIRHERHTSMLQRHDRAHISREELENAIQVIADSLNSCDNRNQADHREIRDMIIKIHDILDSHLDKGK